VKRCPTSFPSCISGVFENAIDLKAYAANFLKGLKLLNLIFIPCYIVIFVLAEDIVNVLLGTKWFEIILPIRICA
jgi:O-antigen/teichoic acid export membrane protein